MRVGDAINAAFRFEVVILSNNQLESWLRFALFVTCQIELDRAKLCSQFRSVGAMIERRTAADSLVDDAAFTRPSDSQFISIRS